MKRKTLTAAWVLVAAAMVGGCKAKKTYPDPDLGWHSADYSIVMGRLQRIAGKEADEPPIWLIRYDVGKDKYRGEFALTPVEKMVGYAGGEMVEIRGSIKPEDPKSGYHGPWYEVREIRLWTSFSGK
jgi:hypothetical protein